MSDDTVRLLRQDIRELYTKLNALAVQLARIEAASAAANTREQVDDLDDRVRTLENLEQRRLGGGVVIGLICGAFGSVSMALLGWWLSKR